MCGQREESRLASKQLKQAVSSMDDSLCSCSHQHGMHGPRPAVEVVACLQAKLYKEGHRLSGDRLPLLAACPTIGAHYGVGLGLYFEVIAW